MRLLRPRWVGLAILVVALLLAGNEFRPVGAVTAAQSIGSSSGGGEASSIPWPAGAQAAIGGSDGGAVATTPSARPEPIASVAKVMTALEVLALKPLQKGQDGPSITVSPDDVAELQQDQAGGQSVVPVQAGEQLSERQALQALLIPSGNNIAAILARWSAGSVDAMVQQMNARARAMGLSRTTFADVSGFSASTVSVPADLVRLGQRAMEDPVLADIVGLPQVSLPVAGISYNVNYVLGRDGIVGVKTGNIPQGGAIYLFAASVPVAGRTALLVGAVQGLSTLDLAFSGARTLLAAARDSLRLVHVVSHLQTVGRYALPWGGGSDVVAASDLDILVWPGTVVRTRLETQAVNAAVAQGSTVGSLHVSAGDASFDVPVTNVDRLPGPGRLARLTRLTW